MRGVLDEKIIKTNNMYCIIFNICNEYFYG